MKTRLLLCIWAWAAPAQAQSLEEADLALAFGDPKMVSIATGTAQPRHRAPAVTTVITAADIAAMGASDIEEVLEAVPGLHVGRTNLSNSPRFLIRGMFGTYNPEVLMLLNGAPMTMSFVGNRGQVWAGMPVAQISRIEVVRGPGSALYGAEALAGVINIVTKSAAEIDGARLALRLGSFDTADAHALYGGKLGGGLELMAYLRAARTAGHGATVEADAQSRFDGRLGTRASLAPGPSNARYRAVDGHLELSRGPWRWRNDLRDRSDVGTGVGIAEALDPAGYGKSRRLSSDLIYDNRNFSEHWSLSGQASFVHYVEKSRLTLFPAGAFGGAFPDGVIGNPDKWERHLRLSLTAGYRGWRGHQIRLGAGHDRLELYKVVENKNFTPTLAPLPGGVTDVTATAPFLFPNTRRVSYVLAQDEWSFARDWTLTLGLRHDRYSDFGGTSNPRLALVWEAAYNLSLKLLHGSAFRAPSFVELYGINNPVALGNSKLQPERVKTDEFAVNWQARDDLRVAASIYRYRRVDVIQFLPQAGLGQVAQNVARIKGHGGELELEWQPGRDWRLQAHYALQRSRDASTGRDTGFAPENDGYLRVEWLGAAQWRPSAQLNRIGPRPRPAGDTRAALKGYTAVDLNLRLLSSDWELTASARNLFGADVREPSNAGAAIPFDIPLAGRDVWLQLSRKL